MLRAFLERPRPTDVVGRRRTGLVGGGIETAEDREAAVDVVHHAATEHRLARGPRQGSLILKALQEDRSVLRDAPGKRPLNRIGVVEAAVRCFIRDKAHVPVDLPAPWQGVEKEQRNAWLGARVKVWGSPGSLHVDLHACGRHKQLFIFFEEVDLGVENEGRKADNLRLTETGIYPRETISIEAKLDAVCHSHPQEVVPAVALRLERVDARGVGQWTHFEIVPASRQRVGAVREVGGVWAGCSNVWGLKRRQRIHGISKRASKEASPGPRRVEIRVVVTLERDAVEVGRIGPRRERLGLGPWQPGTDCHHKHSSREKLPKSPTTVNGCPRLSRPP